MPNPLKELFLKRYLNLRLKLIRHGERAYNFADELKKVKNILVLLPVGHEYEEATQDFLKQLGAIFPQGRVSTFVKSTLRKSDLNWMGVPNDTYLKVIQDGQIDLVIDLNQPQDRIVSYLVALSGAPLRLNLAEGEWDDNYNLHFRLPAGASPKQQLAHIGRQLQRLVSA
ncbi:MAG TPA: hypothetical protein ENJ10_05295 [Caldithrix abyssi]|uniref:Uncharacterized protein n=1 Tax=Caldithrix abyssi TaxID=187145 RepID=A0A7V1PU40_CALAY|nr:hypothetical protein [Caldithrix abyssi]